MPKQINIPAKELEQMYWKEGMTLKDIGEKYNQTPSAIFYKMKKNNIKLRKGSTKMIPQINESSANLYYLLGVLNGDGCISNNTFRVAVNDKDFALNVFRALKNLKLQGTLLPTSDNRWLTYFSSIKFCKIMSRKNNLNRIPSKRKLRIAYLNGLYDSEGSVIIDKHRHKTVSFCNTEQLINKQVHEILRSFNINFSARKFKSRNYIAVNTTIDRINDVMKFHKHFKFSIRRKQLKLNHIIDSYKKEVNS